MKRLILFFFAVALLSSCIEETLPVDSPAAESAPAFSGVRENFVSPGKGTKTILRYDRSVEWTEGDEVGLFDGTIIDRNDANMPNEAAVDDGWRVSYKYVAASNGNETSFSYEYNTNDSEDHKSHVPAPVEDLCLYVCTVLDCFLFIPLAYLIKFCFQLRRRYIEHAVSVTI